MRPIHLLYSLMLNMKTQKLFTCIRAQGVLPSPIGPGYVSIGDVVDVHKRMAISTGAVGSKTLSTFGKNVFLEICGAACMDQHTDNYIH